MKLTQFFTQIANFCQNNFFSERDNWILWSPIIFASGIGFYFLDSRSILYFPEFLILILAFSLIFTLRNSLLSLIPIAITLFLSGFLWVSFYNQKIIYTPQIDGKVYAQATGRIIKLKGHEKVLKSGEVKKSHYIVIDDVELNKVDYAKLKLAKSKQQSKRKSKKLQNDKKLKKHHKLSKTTIKTYHNIEGYQDVDREISAIDYEKQNKHWEGSVYKDPPRKISVNVRTDLGEAKIGDLIQVNVFLEPLSETDIIGGYNFRRYALFQGIGGSGYATSAIEVLQIQPQSNFIQYLTLLRHNIAKKIIEKIEGDEAAILVAMLVGIRDFISKDLNAKIQNAGLSHLLAISGLHLALVTGFFFILTRFLLSFNGYLALNYDIKKIAAFLAIIGGIIYLLLSGAPVSAVRSFVMVVLVFLAIIFDERHDVLRSLALAAFIILIFNPNLLLAIGFQLSFAAVLGLVSFYNFIKNKSEYSQRSIYVKIPIYFRNIILCSIIAGIATTPLVIYYFNKYAQYSILANLMAIPIASFVIMPFGFLSLILMPFHLEFAGFYPASFGAELMVKVIDFIATLPNHFLTIKTISTTSIILVIFGALWLCLWQKIWRLFGLPIIIIGIYLAYNNPLPNLLIDGKSKFFAIYDQENGLIFSKKMRSTRQFDNWMQKMGVTKLQILEDLSEEELKSSNIDCNKLNCQLQINNKSILILLKRNKIDFICNHKAEIIINMTKKYQLPNCILNNSKTIINNTDLFTKGSYFLYLED